MLFSRSDKLKNLTDAELILKFKDTSKNDYLGILFERYSHLVYGLCLKHLKNEAESKDAVINIFEKLMTDLKKHDVKYFKSWLYMVSKNHCLMFLRNKQSQVKRELDVIRAETSRLEIVDDYMEKQELKEMKLSSLEEAIEGLNPEQKQCIKLFYLQEMCYNDVADETGFTLNQVKSYIQNGKRNLKNILTTSDGPIITS